MTETAIPIGPDAPGAPGISPRWTSSAKSAVGTALTTESRVWFTVSHGILNEVYHPTIDTACIRDLGLLVSTPDGDFFDEKRDATCGLTWFADGVPGIETTNELPGRLTIEKAIFSDPSRSVLIQHTTLTGLPDGGVITALLAPHIANRGADNLAWVGSYKGIEMLFASARGTTLAFACDRGWRRTSAGYVGTSDGWQDVRANGRLSWRHRRAGPGNVALAGEVDLAVGDTSFTLALAFGETADEAALNARISLDIGAETIREDFHTQWSEWASTGPPTDDALSAASRTVIRVHESKAFPGASVASLSIPWGFAKGDEDMGGYHLVWPRDMAEAIGGMLAAGGLTDAVRGLEYLRATQEADGHWPQNMWLDGSPYWGGIQMDEVALPVLVVELAIRAGCPIDLAEFWPMVSAAVSYIVRDGPVTGQDRWEEDGGFSPFTVAAETAALVVAADMADTLGKVAERDFLLETADTWASNVERWMYVSGTDLATECAVAGYYVRIAPPDVAEGSSPATGWVPIKNRPPQESSARAEEIVSPDALALVRFGLRGPDDPRIVDTVTVVDQLLRHDFDAGPAWRRYVNDGYGEHDDGSPFDGTGVGRPWPLLTGERAHYELAAGRRDEAESLRATLASFAGPHVLLPEQLWDGPDIPDQELIAGGQSGSAMPLVWAHAEYLKLVRSIADGRIFDTPPAVSDRYAVSPPPLRTAIWSKDFRIKSMPHGCDLRIQLPERATVRWSNNSWSTWADAESRNILGVEHVRIPCDRIGSSEAIEFTARYADGWEGNNHRVVLIREGRS